MKKLFIISIILLLAASVNAQSTNVSTLLFNNQKKADYFYDHLAFKNALQLYLRVVDKDPLNVYARERITLCYLRLMDPKSAEFWISALAKEPDIRPEIKYLYAEVLSMNQKYEDSKFWFEQYAKQVPGDKRAKDKIAMLSHIQDYMSDSLRFVVANAAFNSAEADFGADYFKDGVVFASTRNRDLFIKRQSFDAVSEDETLLNLYFVPRSITGDFGEVTSFRNEDLKSVFHDGPIVFYDNDKKAAFTRNMQSGSKPVYDANGRVNLEIFFADVAGFGRLKNIKPFAFNNPGYSVAHPSVSSRGDIMFFSSTLPQGFGGSDIYYTINKEGVWQEPVNAGPTINTAGDELFPYLANDTTLYFSSNGHGSLGGLDIMVSYRRKENTFSPTHNFGAPLNSSYDDFSIVTDSTGRIGYFASNRPGGKGHDDVYFFIANYYFLAGEVRELSREQSRLADTKISVYNGNGDFMDSVRSDENGNFRLNLPYDQDFLIRGEKDGYETLEDLKFSTRGKAFGIDSLLLPMWRYKLFAKGRIFSNESQKLLPGATVLLKNITDNRTDSIVVNENGEYTFLVRPNKQYEIQATKDGFIPDGFKLNTKDLFEGELLNDIVLEEVYIEKEIIFFDYNSINISAKSMNQMDHILRTLKKYPSATLNIGAHADSRGTKQYNQKLSERRANVALQYFLSKGISSKRITSQGFGEELILNRCSDGVECPEEEHSKNRRAEIKIQRTVIKRD